MKYLWSIVIAGLLLAASACSKDNNTGSLYTPGSADVTATATLEELQQGRILYIDNCGSCHHLYSPDDFSASRWRNIISDMAPKTGMSSSETALVTKYVTRGN
jgi:hypothetical protein